MEKIVLTNVPIDELIDRIVERLASSNQVLNKSQEESDVKEYLSIEEASKLIGLAISTIYSLTHRNEIPHIKKGKKLWFKRSELLQWLDSGHVESQEDLEAKAMEDLRKFHSRKRR
jgi:excisionase family DNA binding protein